MKRIISCILVLALMLSCISFSVFAADSTTVTMELVADGAVMDNSIRDTHREKDGMYVVTAAPGDTVRISMQVSADQSAKLLSNTAVIDYDRTFFESFTPSSSPSNMGGLVNYQISYINYVLYRKNMFNIIRSAPGTFLQLSSTPIKTVWFDLKVPDNASGYGDVWFRMDAGTQAGLTSDSPKLNNTYGINNIRVVVESGTWTVRYQDDSGNAAAETQTISKVRPQVTVNAPNSDVKKLYYTFGGWKLSTDTSDNPTVYQPNSAYTVLGDTIFVPHWVAVPEPAAPNVNKEDTTSVNGMDGKITDTASTMEYRPADSGTWKPITGTTVEGLPKGTYQVRYKADPLNNTPASKIASVTISDPEVTLYTVTPDIGANGSITPASAVQVPAGNTTPVTVTADNGYLIDKVTVNGTAVAEAAGQDSYSWNVGPVNTNTTIKATFKAKPDSSEYTVTPAAGENGSIMPASAIRVPAGSTTSVTVKANRGYLINKVTVNGTEVSAAAGKESYTWNVGPVNADTTVKATFKSGQSPIDPGTNPTPLADYTVTVKSSDNGSVTSDVTRATAGSTVTL